MKALFTFFFLAFFTCSGALAQDMVPEPEPIPKKNLKKPGAYVFGLRAGGNLSNFSNHDPFSDKKYLGYHAGMFLDMHPSKNYGYSLELNYANQGGDSGYLPYTMHYLVFPVLFNLYVSELALQGGLYAAPLLSATTRRYTTYDATGTLNGLDYGLAFGIKRALGRVGVGLRYYNGLTGVVSRVNGKKMANQKLEISLRVNL